MALPVMWKRIFWGLGIIVGLCFVGDYIRTKVQSYRPVAVEKKTQEKESPVVQKTEEAQEAPSQKPEEPVQRASARPYPLPGEERPMTYAQEEQKPVEAPVVSNLPQGFSSSGIPARPAYQNEEEQKAVRQREEYLVSQMFSPYVSAEEKKTSIKELGNYPYFRVAKALSMVLLRDQNAELRIEAGMSLGRTGNLSFVPALEQVINSDPDPRVKEAAEKALADIKSRASQPVL